MNHQLRPWRRAVARALVLAFAFALAPVYCLAEESPGPPQSTPRLTASIQQAVEYEIGKAGKAPAIAARQESGQSTADRSSTSFFRTRAGIITLAIVAAGTGYALYSTSNDRVKSPNRSYGGGR